MWPYTAHSGWTHPDSDKKKRRIQGANQAWEQRGFALDLTQLIYFDERNHAAGYLAGNGWQVTASTITELFATQGLPPFDEDEATRFADRRYVSAVLR
ncbi:hypothetical protein [Mycobacterium basiliense]|nr:hypothetical protein [Mycobacterium basiliense]